MYRKCPHVMAPGLGLVIALSLAGPASAAGASGASAAARPAPTTQTLFSDANGVAGISFVHTGLLAADQMQGTGAAWFDFDRDGDLDLYVTRRVGSNAFYVNQGDGTFVDRAQDLAIHDASHDGSGIAAADFDNDGWIDFYLANSDEDRLFRNVNGTSFADVTLAFGIDVASIARGTSAAWGDYDGDGFLDLYVANHIPVSGSGDIYDPDLRRDRVYHNEGGTRFTEVTGMFDPRDLEGFGFIGAWTDFDDDGDLDIFLVNDCPLGPQSTRIFRNDGGDDPLAWTFTEVSARMNANHCVAGMGIAIGDYDRDGRLDYFYTNDGTPILLHNEGTVFRETTRDAGVDDVTILETGRQRWTWGCNFIDYDLDGWLDLYLAAGALRTLPDRDPQPNMLFRARGDATYQDVSVTCGADDINRSRTSVMADYDQDGDLDMFVVNYEAPAYLYRNENRNGNHFLAVELQGVESNRDGIGARIRIRAPDGTYRYEETHSGTSLGGGDAPGAFFGLASHTRVEEVRIRWPSGGVQVLENVDADQRLRVVEAPNRPTTDLVNFTARIESGQPTLRWSTANETDNAGFDVEVMEDGTYRAVGFVAGNGTTFRPNDYVFRPGFFAPGDYDFRLVQKSADGSTVYSPVATLEVRTPPVSVLSAAEPNPFHPATQLTIEVDADQTVRVEVHDVTGRRVATLYDGLVRAGAPRAITFEGGGLASGIYFVKAWGSTFAATRKVTLLR